MYQHKREQHLKIIHDFFRSFESRLTFVAPSDYTLKKWLSFYPEYNRCSIVIPHQKGEGQYNGNRKHIPDVRPLRLAFPGSQKLIKGWEVFKQIVEKTRKAKCNYEFFYLGNGGEKVEGVHNIGVDVATQGKEAMITALRKEKIDVSFLISNVAETYSYTTYESHAANCFIIALKSGGNIPFLVNEEHWGAVFDSEDDLIQTLLSEDEFRKIINSWIDASPLGPDHYVDNDDIVKLFPAGSKSKMLWRTRKDKPLKRIKRTALNQAFIMTRLKGKAD